MVTRFNILFVFVLLTGCGLSPEPVELPAQSKSEDIAIETKYYSTYLKSPERWRITKIIEDYHGVILKRANQPPFCRIMIIRKSVAEDGIAGKSAREMADAIRNREKQGMITLGVDKGLYRLKGVSMEQHVLNGKTFYTMNYKTVPNQGQGHEAASLYLYFPKITDNTDYILAHFSQTYVDPEPAGPSCRMAFIRILENLTIKQK
jgi:hypothetical protein